MKRRIFGILLLLVLLLSACDSEPESSVYTVVHNDKTFTVDTAQGTITCGEDVYQFTVSSNSATRNTTFIYPNGARYYWNEGEYSGSGGWSDDYDPERYIRGNVLSDVLEEAKPVRTTRERQGNPLIGILCILIGGLNLAAPQLIWYLNYGWRFKDAEPSDLALGVARFGGGVAIIIGIILIFI